MCRWLGVINLKLSPTVVIQRLSHGHTRPHWQICICWCRRRGEVDLLTAFSVHVRKHYSQYEHSYTAGSKDPENQMTGCFYSSRKESYHSKAHIKLSGSLICGDPGSSLGSALGRGKCFQVLQVYCRLIQQSISIQFKCSCTCRSEGKWASGQVSKTSTTEIYKSHRAKQRSRKWFGKRQQKSGKSSEMLKYEEDFCINLIAVNQSHHLETSVGEDVMTYRSSCIMHIQDDSSMCMMMLYYSTC